MSSPEVDILIVGAGIVGLACARAAAQAGYSVLVVERHAGAGRETSSRNSGVIHAGLYYPVDSLKAKLCVRGRGLLYRFCREHNVLHQRCGKWVLANGDTEVEALEALARQANENGVESISLVDGNDFKLREPSLRAQLALWSAGTGLIDAHGFVDALRRTAIDAGATMVWQTEVVDIKIKPGAMGLAVQTRSSANETFAVTARQVINASGLESDRLAFLLGMNIDALGYRMYFYKGDYFSLSGAGSRPKARLVYPIRPVDRSGLGIHLTKDFGGRWVAGPDSAPVGSIDYAINESKAESFAAAIRRYLPDLPELDAGGLAPDYSGIRTRRKPAGEFSDFAIDDSSVHGVEGFIQLSGIESPGLTAALAIAEVVVGLVH